MADPLIGKKIGKYQIQSELGRGGMGVVYRAYDPDLRRTVAIKILTQQLAADDDFVKRFQQEAIMSANLHHPHIITIYDVGAVDDLHFLIMQYLEGARALGAQEWPDAAGAGCGCGAANRTGA
jgi:serine/threonine-protein kinase